MKSRLSFRLICLLLSSGALLVAPLRSQEGAPFTPEAGAQVELRCTGPNGVFDHPAPGDDFVAILPLDPAATPESIQAAGTILTAFYKFFGSSPVNQTCRFYRVLPPDPESAGTG